MEGQSLECVTTMTPRGSDVSTPPEACDHPRKTLFEGLLVMN